MKVLIVDDEKHVRKAIELSIDWEKYGISELLMAEDGIEAMQMVHQHRPAILFCDMKMPRMDGTKLLQQLREEYVDMQIIVVSGFDDFHYTRATIRAWCIDYLLKPLRKRDLEQALEKAVTNWLQIESSKQREMKASYQAKLADRLLEERRLIAYLQGETSSLEAVDTLLQRVSGQTKHLWIALALPRNRLQLVHERFGGDEELFLFSVNNIASEVLRSFGSYTFCRLDAFQWVLLIAERSDNDATDNYTVSSSARLIDGLRKLSETWYRTLGLEILVGIAEKVVPFDQLTTAVSQARASLLKSDVLDGDKTQAGNHAEIRLSDKQSLLETALLGGNEWYAVETIRSFVLAVKERGSLNLKGLQAYTLEANLMMDRACRLIPTAVELADLHLPYWISDLDEWEELMIRSWRKLVAETDGEGTGQHAIALVKEYMDAHYQEDITLTSLSVMFHFSRQHIAKKFKDVYHTTVVAYLTDLRMEKAKSLLANTEMPIQEISELSGYIDGNYFGRVFKKQTNQSPMQYRKQQQIGGRDSC